jgi:hypothetical protein
VLPVLRQVRPVLLRRRVQPLLLRLRAAWAAHEPRAMIDLQCNVHTAICVQYWVGATAAQAGFDKRKTAWPEPGAKIMIMGTTTTTSYKIVNGTLKNISSDFASWATSKKRSALKAWITVCTCMKASEIIEMSIMIFIASQHGVKVFKSEIKKAFLYGEALFELQLEAQSSCTSTRKLLTNASHSFLEAKEG